MQNALLKVWRAPRLAGECQWVGSASAPRRSAKVAGPRCPLVQGWPLTFYAVVLQECKGAFWAEHDVDADAARVGSHIAGAQPQGGRSCGAVACRLPCLRLRAQGVSHTAALSQHRIAHAACSLHHTQCRPGGSPCSGAA